MRPDEVHRDAIEAAHAWRDEERARLIEPAPKDCSNYESVWFDSGSGPGYTVVVPKEVNRG